MQRCSPRFKSVLHFTWEIFEEYDLRRRHVGWAPTWRPEPTETSVTELCYESVNSALKELIN